MPIHNDLDRAARDPYYRALYEGERMVESVSKTRFPHEKINKQQKKEKDEESKVICTRLHQVGLMSRSDYLLGLRFVRENLTERHERGYHAWAIGVVRWMRRSSRATAFWSWLASARADHIAHFYGDTARRNRFGAVLCALGHSVCYLIGGLVGEQDWRALYRDEAGPASHPSA
jgi:hypothetical protein